MPDRGEPVEPALIPPGPGAVVRMYHTGFGDCFLLAFHADDGKSRHVLIDCGTHQGDSRARERLELVAKDIRKAAGNRLAALAVTHEHADHLSGFFFGNESFSAMEIDNLWLAWTEDPANPVANELREMKKANLQALRAAVALLKASGNPDAERIEGVLGFEDLMAAGKRGNKAILENLRSWSKKKPENPGDYRAPGEKPFSIPGVSGVRCFVLGPPPEIGHLKKLVSQKETYPGFAPLTGESLFGAAVMKAAEEEALSADPSAGGETGTSDAICEQFVRSCPFDERSGLTKEQAAEGEFAKFFRDCYGITDEDRGPAWRRIETDWLGVAGQLALSINSMTNNTSLVLAFELAGADTSPVLLFVGDAQVGNWLSWQDLSWPGAGPGGEEVTGKDLLRRTVLYKVGHHGSTNATLSKKGLEMMESPDLVAMIPVDQEWASTTQNWQHPEESVVKRLMEKTKGRVIRSDRIPENGPLEKPEGMSDAVWTRFLENLEWDQGPDHLWIQYTIRIP
jgi:beta-lactamase superfamily II metal-dependent hydrolase